MGEAVSFQNGAALFWLIPASAVLLALYLLKMRRKPIRVPATFLWPQQTEEIRANALFQRPRLNLLFWLQLAALTALVICLAGPQLLTRSLTGRVTMIVLDGSASMRATDVSPNRFEEAKKLARQAIDELKPGDRIGVVLAGTQPRVVFPLTDQPQVHRGKLDAAEAEDVSCDMGEALRLAAASLTAYQGARILVLSDGAFRPVEAFSLEKGEVLFRPVGRSARNMGISALGATVSARGKELYCAVRNYGLDASNAELTIEADGKVVDARDVRVKGGGTFGTTVLVPASAKLCRATLQVDDALAADNVRVATLGEGSALRVLLVGPGDYFLERALTLDPRVTLERSARVPASERAGGTGAGTYDLVVFSGSAESPVKARGVLAFGKPSSASPVTGSGQISRPEYLSREDHPAVRDLEFGDVYVEQAAKVTPKSTAKSILDSKAGPLVVAGEAPGQRKLYVSFELTKSDWPLHVSFPIFIGQTLTFLAGEGRLDQAAVAAGNPFTIPLGPGEEFRAPEGVRWSQQEGYAIVRGLPRVGSYDLKVGSRKQTYFANLEDPDEPKIEPAAFVQLGGTKVGKTAVPQRPSDLWKWAVLAGLAVLAVEWWVFVRRS